MERKTTSKRDEHSHQPPSEVRVNSAVCGKDVGIINTINNSYALLSGIYGRSRVEHQVEKAKERLSSHFASVTSTDPDLICRDLERAFRDTSSEIESFLTKNGGVDAAAVKISTHGEDIFANIASIGNAGIYLLRNGSLSLVNEPDLQIVRSIVGKKGLTGEEYDNEYKRLLSIVGMVGSRFDYEVLSDEEQYCYRSRVVTDRGLGTGHQIDPYIESIKLEDGDKLLIATSGIMGNLSDAEIAVAMQFRIELDEAEYLAEEASIHQKSNNFDEFFRASSASASAIVLQVSHEKTALQKRDEAIIAAQEIIFDHQKERKEQVKRDTIVFELENETRVISDSFERIDLSLAKGGKNLQIVRKEALKDMFGIWGARLPEGVDMFVIDPGFMKNNYGLRGWVSLPSGKEVNIGRDYQEPSGIMLFNERVSPNHLSIKWEEESSSLSLKDTSSNGTRVIIIPKAQ